MAFRAGPTVAHEDARGGMAVDEQGHEAKALAVRADGDIHVQVHHEARILLTCHHIKLRRDIERDDILRL